MDLNSGTDFSINDLISFPQEREKQAISPLTHTRGLNSGTDFSLAVSQERVENQNNSPITHTINSETGFNVDDHILNYSQERDNQDNSPSKLGSDFNFGQGTVVTGKNNGILVNNLQSVDGQIDESNVAVNNGDQGNHLNNQGQINDQTNVIAANTQLNFSTDNVTGTRSNGEGIPVSAGSISYITLDESTVIQQIGLPQIIIVNESENNLDSSNVHGSQIDDTASITITESHFRDLFNNYPIENNNAGLTVAGTNAVDMNALPINSDGNIYGVPEQQGNAVALVTPGNVNSSMSVGTINIQTSTNVNCIWSNSLGPKKTGRKKKNHTHLYNLNIEDFRGEDRTRIRKALNSRKNREQKKKEEKELQEKIERLERQLGDKK